jgi:microcystin synthetase protein McyG
LRGHLEKPLLAVLFNTDGATSALDQTAYTQPALFAVEYALARLWESFGIVPHAVLGHSVGEYVAACIAGVFGLEDALQLIAARGRLMQALPPDGAMAVAMTNAARVEEIVAPLAHEVSIAAYNGPANVVFSGRKSAVEHISATLRQAGIAVTPLNVSHAFHSPLVEPMLDEFEQIARTIQYSRPRIPVVSNVSGAIAGAEIATAAYWRRHVREPVRFSDGMDALVREGCTMFLEAGPNPVLIGMARAGAAPPHAVWCPSLRRGQSDWKTLLESVGRAYVHGVSFDGEAVHRGAGGRRVPLPTYAFQGESYRVDYQVPIASTTLVGTLSERDEQALLSRLAATAQFNAQELAVLPRLLKALRAANQPVDSQGARRDFLYELAWREVSLASPNLVSTGLSVSRIEPALRQLGQTFPSQAGLAEELERASRAHVTRALSALEWNPHVGDIFDPSVLARQLGIVPRYRAVFARLLDTLRAGGTLELCGEEYRVVRELDASSADAAVPGLDTMPRTSRLGAAEPLELALLNRCGSQLAAVLRGACDPLALIFPEGEAASTREFYRNSAAAGAHNALARQALQGVVAEFPRHRRLRILEIGAGTGGTTAHLLPVLDPARTEYVFTDVGPYFLNQAQHEFGALPFVQFRTLDIERAPLAQGWDEREFDVIVASNVLHATHDLRQTLAHVRSLLAPGGVLLLIEVSEGRTWIDLTFGLTEGWWRFRDHALRTGYPLLTGAAWCKLLREEGFDQCLDVAPIAESVLPQALIVARAKEVDADVPVKAQPEWIIFDDRAGTGERLAALLRKRHKRCTITTANASRMVATDAQVEGIVYCAGLDAGLGVDPTAGDIMAAAHRAIAPALDVVRAVLEEPRAQSARLYLVSCCATSADAVRIEGLAQAPLWGLGANIALEHPDLQCTCIDLDAKDDRALRALADELLARSAEDRIAFREGRRRVPRLERASAHALSASGNPLRIDASAAYLITGGLGGLGLRFAQWLCERGARHLVLVGRRALDADANALLAQLREQGATITVRALDVADGAAIAKLVGEFGSSLPPLRGVLHAAGELDDAALSDQQWERFARVFAAKVAGTWHLHCATRTLPLDFFVLFSSASALLGNPGQANHAAANAFLDQLAQVRRAQGLPALSINWGAWGAIGAAAGTEIVERIARRGFAPFSPQEGLEAADLAIRAAVPQIVAVAVDWAVFAQQQAMPLIADLVTGQSSGTVEHGAEDIRVSLKSAPIERRTELLLEAVRAEVARVIGVTDAAAISPEKGFFTLGLDSLTSVELRNRLQKVLRAELPSTIAFDYPTLVSLTHFLQQEILTDVFAPGTPLAAPIDAAAASMAPDSDDAAIARELAELQSVLARG